MYIHLHTNTFIFIDIHTHTYTRTYTRTHTCIHTLHYITLHYITLHYITLHYITLHYITLHYITYIHTYIHINLYFMIDILHHFFVEFCIPDESVGCTIWNGAWQPWILDSYWLKSLPATAAGISLWLKWVFIPECRPLVPVRQSPTSSRQIRSCCYHMPKVVPVHMPGLDWELQLRCARCLIH